MTPTQAAMAKRMINASICAYQVHPTGWVPAGGPAILRKINDPSGDFFYDVVPTYQDAVGFTGTAASGYAPLFTSTGADFFDEDAIDAAVVGAMNDGNLLVSLRGTIPPTFDNDDIFAWLADWRNDFRIEPRSWSVNKGPYLHSSKVATGFADAMLSLWPNIARMIETTLSTNNCTGVVITGHSKGAAMTFLAAELVASGFPQFKDAIQVHAFAAPAIGNAEFKAFYGSLAATTHRYQVANDLVPFLPLWVGADAYAAIKFPKQWMNDALDGAFVIVAVETEGGYHAVGDMTYSDTIGSFESGPQALANALAKVAATMSACQFTTVAGAHSAVNNYLPHFG
jgi:hypothetical protein